VYCVYIQFYTIQRIMYDNEFVLTYTFSFCSTENTTLCIAFLRTILSLSVQGGTNCTKVKWFAYNALEFLRDRDKPRKGLL
jgi:hypothetical protein